jgi:uncharacterized protein YjiS (DUF1127 family)
MKEWKELPDGAWYEKQERRAKERTERFEQLRREYQELTSQDRERRALERILDEQDVAQRQLRLLRWTMLASVVGAVMALATFIVSLRRG